MRYAEWGILLVISGLGIALANFIGFDVGFMESLPGILILLGISAAAVVVSKLVPLRLPIVAYCSIIGCSWQAPYVRPGSSSSRRRTASILQRPSHWREPTRASPSRIRSNPL